MKKSPATTPDCRSQTKLGRGARASGAALAGTASSASAQQASKIAVALSLTGPNASIGRPDLDGVRLAIEEANAARDGRAIGLDVHDDVSNVETGRKLAQEISAGDALLDRHALAAALSSLVRIEGVTGQAVLKPSDRRPWTQIAQTVGVAVSYLL
jgi:hypothetical protein